MAVLGLCFCARAFSSCGKRGPLFIAVRGPLTIAASPVAEHRLQTRRLSNCGSRDQSLRDIWDLPRPGLEAVSPALAGRFSTTAPPGKPPTVPFYLVEIASAFIWTLWVKQCNRVTWGERSLHLPTAKWKNELHLPCAVRGDRNHFRRARELWTLRDHWKPQSSDDQRALWVVSASHPHFSHHLPHQIHLYIFL